MEIDGGGGGAAAAGPEGDCEGATEIDGGGDEEGDCDGGGRSWAGGGAFTGGWDGLGTDGAGDDTGGECFSGSETAPEKANNAATITDRKISFTGEAIGNCSTNCKAMKDGSRVGRWEGVGHHM